MNQTCNVCGAPRTAESETARVRSNVRRFREERFELWRCAACQSLHAAQDVDLAHYYAGYPVFDAALDWRLHVVYANLLRRLRRAGLRPEHRILDYGCGKGPFVRYLREQGYAHATGYDRFAEGWNDTSVLDAHYDCVVSQDVIEHVDDPAALLQQFAAMVEPGGIVVIGTPDAAVLDLRDAENYVHALHQPYHRHILSVRALIDLGRACGWAVERHYDTMYNNTLVPTMNPRFVLHYVRCHDDTFDLVVEPVKANSLRLWTPLTLFFALFGYFFDRHTDIMVVFRTPGGAARATGVPA